MPLDAPLALHAAALDAAFAALPAEEMLRRALLEGALGRIALVSSFGAESAVLLHMAAQIDRAVPVLFLDTLYHFPETLAHVEAVARDLGLTNLTRITPPAAELAADDPDGTLHRRDAPACCALRKTRPLEAALAPFDAWITGRKRQQSASRASLAYVEAEGEARLKLNPLRDWDRARLEDYMTRHALPRHPLAARGYASIGCAPCTTPVGRGEDPRAGRWRGTAIEECGIHFIGGRMVRNADRRMIVTDTGAVPEAGEAAPLVLAPDAGPTDLAAARGAPVVEVSFPSFSDGRGFTLARRLRAEGFTGRLRAAGPLLPDQYAMARRSGFDEVAVPPALFARQGGAAAWASRADWRAYDHRARLAG